MLMQQPERRAKAEAIDELDDRNEFFKPIFERRTGQHEGVCRRRDALDAASRTRVPVLDALRFVENDEVEAPNSGSVPRSRQTVS